MLNFYIAYLVVIVIALAQWAYMRSLLTRGLQIEFQKFRQVRSMDFFFSRFTKPYLALMLWTLFYIGFICYCAIRFLMGYDLLNIESCIFTVLAVIFFAKDRVYYVTAVYVLSKKGEQA